jgi:coenzyme PQQ precursor peptide PqqA
LFWRPAARSCEIIIASQQEIFAFTAKKFTGELFVPQYLIKEDGVRPVDKLIRRAKMAWKTPKIVEVPVGMEINMYACAARK